MIDTYIKNKVEYLFENNSNKYKISAKLNKIPISFKSVLWYISKKEKII